MWWMLMHACKVCPKPVISYMCKSSLVGWPQTEIHYLPLRSLQQHLLNILPLPSLILYSSHSSPLLSGVESNHDFFWDFPSLVPLAHEHLPNLVHQIIQVHWLVLLYPIVEAFYKVVGHVVYLASSRELASCPQFFVAIPYIVSCSGLFSLHGNPIF